MDLDRIYDRTEAGQKALDDSTSSKLRAETRWMLGLVSAGTHAHEIRRGMRRYPDERIAELLMELESLGLISSVQGSTHHNLDFTGSFSIAELAAAAKKADGKSDSK
jgi:hypothetical protein